MCTYRYVATQELFQGEMQQNLTFTATVEISCDSGMLVKLYTVYMYIVSA